MHHTDLVFVGDVCDRGYNSKDIYDLVMRWQGIAPTQDSRVWFLLGNHEVMNAYGLAYYNTAEEYLSFDATSVAAGRRAHTDAFGKDGWLYRWLCEQRAIVQIGTFIFGHGDLPMALSDWTVEEIDERVMEVFRSRSQKRSMSNLPDTLFAPEKSILWCREAQLDRAPRYGEALARFLAQNLASAYVCGHTPSEEGRFRIGYGNRYLCIDTAMTFERQGVGGKSALLIENGTATAAYFEANDVHYQTIPLRFESTAR